MQFSKCLLLSRGGINHISDKRQKFHSGRGEERKWNLRKQPTGCRTRKKRGQLRRKQREKLRCSPQAETKGRTEHLFLSSAVCSDLHRWIPAVYASVFSFERNNASFSDSLYASEMLWARNTQTFRMNALIMDSHSKVSKSWQTAATWSFDQQCRSIYFADNQQSKYEFRSWYDVTWTLQRFLGKVNPDMTAGPNVPPLPLTL